MPPPPKVIEFHGVWLNTELMEIDQEAIEAQKREDPAKMCKNGGELLLATGQRTVSPEFCGARGC